MPKNPLRAIIAQKERELREQQPPLQEPPPEMHGETAAMLRRSLDGLADPESLVLPVDAITMDELLRPVNNAHMMELVASIREHGQIQPVIVAAVGDGTYKLIAGAHRLAAMQYLHSAVNDLTYAQIRAVLHGSVSARVVAYTENAQRKDFDPSEEAAVLVDLMDEWQCDQQTLARRIGKSAAYVSRYINLHGADEQAKRQIDSGELTMRAWLSGRDPQAQDAADNDTDDAPAAAPKKKKRAEQRVAIPLSVARDLVELLGHVAVDLELQPITLDNRATKQDIQSALILRASEINEALRDRDDAASR